MNIHELIYNCVKFLEKKFHAVDYWLKKTLLIETNVFWDWFDLYGFIFYQHPRIFFGLICLGIYRCCDYLITNRVEIWEKIKEYYFLGIIEMQHTIVWVLDKITSRTFLFSEKKYREWFLIGILLYPFWILVWYIVLSHLDYFYQYRVFELLMDLEEHPTRTAIRKVKFRKYCRKNTLRWFLLGYEGTPLISQGDIIVFFFIYLFILWNIFYFLSLFWYEFEGLMEIAKGGLLVMFLIVFVSQIGLDKNIIKLYMRYIFLGYYCAFGYIFWIIIPLSSNATEDYADKDEEIDFYNYSQENVSEYHMEERFGGTELTAMFWETSKLIDYIWWNAWKFTDIIGFLFTGKKGRAKRKKLNRLHHEYLDDWWKNKHIEVSNKNPGDTRRLRVYKNETEITTREYDSFWNTTRQFSLDWRLNVLFDTLHMRFFMSIWEFIAIPILKIYYHLVNKNFHFYWAREAEEMEYWKKHKIVYVEAGGNPLGMTPWDTDIAFNKEHVDIVSHAFTGLNEKFLSSTLHDSDLWVNSEFIEILPTQPFVLRTLVLKVLREQRIELFGKMTNKKLHQRIELDGRHTRRMIFFGCIINETMFLEKNNVVWKHIVWRINDLEYFLWPVYVFIQTLLDDKYLAVRAHERYTYKPLTHIREDYIQALDVAFGFSRGKFAAPSSRRYKSEKLRYKKGWPWFEKQSIIRDKQTFQGKAKTLPLAVVGEYEYIIPSDFMIKYLLHLRSIAKTHRDFYNITYPHKEIYGRSKAYIYCGNNFEKVDKLVRYQNLEANNINYLFEKFVEILLGPITIYRKRRQIKKFFIKVFDKAKTEYNKNAWHFFGKILFSPIRFSGLVLGYLLKIIWKIISFVTFPVWFPIALVLNVTLISPVRKVWKWIYKYYKAEDQDDKDRWWRELKDYWRYTLFYRDSRRNIYTRFKLSYRKGPLTLNTSRRSRFATIVMIINVLKSISQSPLYIRIAKRLGLYVVGNRLNTSIGSFLFSINNNIMERAAAEHLPATKAIRALSRQATIRALIDLRAFNKNKLAVQKEWDKRFGGVVTYVRLGKYNSQNRERWFRITPQRYKQYVWGELYQHSWILQGLLFSFFHRKRVKVYFPRATRKRKNHPYFRLLALPYIVPRKMFRKPKAKKTLYLSSRYNKIELYLLDTGFFEVRRSTKALYYHENFNDSDYKGAYKEWGQFIGGYEGWKDASAWQENMRQRELTYQELLEVRKYLNKEERR